MPEEKIRIFLIDDEPLAIDGWKVVLSKAGDFQIVGETSPRSLLRTLKFLPVFDIVLAGAGLLQLPKSKQVIESLKKLGVNVKILVIVENKNDLRKAQRSGADEAIQSPFQSSALIDVLRGLFLDPKKRCAYYERQLSNIRASRQKSELYETLISDILEFLFAGHLTDRYLKISTFNSDRECSLIFHYGTNHPFWVRMRTEHQSSRLLFDVRNTQSLKPEHVERLSERLTKEIGGIGVLVNHSNPGTSIQKLQIALYKNEGKIILSLTNSQIRDMLMQKAAGIDPTELFQDIYEDVITGL